MLKHRIDVHIEKNSFVDEGDGVVTFPDGLVITDDSEQYNGTKYDIKSLDISTYKGQVTADHIDMLDRIIAGVEGVTKAGNKVLAHKLNYLVKENPLAQLAYNLLISDKVPTDFSIETTGPYPDPESGVYFNAKLVGLSQVVMGNNKNATANQVVLNSIAQSKQAGLDTSKLEEALHLEEQPSKEDGEKPKKSKKTNQLNQEKDMTFVTVKNKRDFAIKVAYKNASGEDVEQELAPDAGVDVSEDQQTAVETQLNSAQKPQPDVQELVKNAVEEARKADTERFGKMEDDLKIYREAFDKGAQEPEFRKPGEHEVRNANGGTSKLESMDWRERVQLLAQNVLASQKGDSRANTVATAINSLHLEQLQKAGYASNSLDLSSIGNFVIPPELVTDIKGNVSNYTPLLSKFTFDETLSLITSWLTRTGDVTMQDIAINTDSGNADLKPLKNPSYSTNTETMTEFAAITPIKAAAIRFSAADLVKELTFLYSHAYDRALATCILGRLSQAVIGNGNVVNYDYSSAAGGNSGALVALISAWADVAEFTPNGVYMMTEKSRLHLIAKALQAGPNGPLATIFEKGPDDIPLFLGRPYVIVPSDIMPSLNTAETRSLVFEGVTVSNTFGVLYADPMNFMGRVSGGLNFEMSAEAAYEDNGTVKSAFQRDEVVFRGYGFRKSAITLASNVAAIAAPGIS
jgi:hypothetical protein